MPGKSDVRRGRIPRRASEHGDFVIDLMGEQMLTAQDLVNTQFPVYDAKDGRRIGNMTTREYLRKFVGDF